MSENTTAIARVIPFRRAELLLVEHNGQPFVPMKPIVEGMGISWQGQHEKLKGGRFQATIKEILIVAQDGREREMTCLPLRKLAGWLMSIHPAKVREPIRESVIAYQNECDDALWAYWNEGIALRSDDRSFETVLGTTIGTDGFHMLGALIKGKVTSLSGASKRRASGKIWSQLHAAFGVRSAQDIPADQLDSARNFVAAYSLEGEWLPKADPVSPYHYPAEWLGDRNPQAPGLQIKERNGRRAVHLGLGSLMTSSFKSPIWDLINLHKASGDNVEALELEIKAYRHIIETQANILDDCAARFAAARLNTPFFSVA